MSVQAAEHNLGHVIASTWPILLDFDGPITFFFINGRSQRLADQLRNVLNKAGVALPGEITTTLDPLAVLRWAALRTPSEVSSAVDSACVSGEHECALESEPTPGAVELLHACHEAGRPVLIVSNNAPGPITEFLDRFHLRHLVDAVVGRTPGRPDLMKPNPHMIEEALTLLDQPAGRCGFVGDSITDIEVARRTGARSIGYAKHQRRGEELAAAGADALVTHMSDLAAAIHADALQRA
jgi:phosphoglycolate phosphatase-like HAD superfamily hydrolase